jgi:RNA polymerase sigma factor (sigma-70 family)
MQTPGDSKTQDPPGSRPRTTAQKQQFGFAELVAQVKAGDDWAMTELMKRYAEPMRRTASQLIGRVLQPQLDSEDLVQSVQLILWLGLRAGKLSVNTPECLLALAKTLLRRKIARHWRSAKATAMASTIDGVLATTVADMRIGAATAETDPRHSAEFDDLVEHFLGQLDDLDRQLVTLRFQGCSTADAARHLQLDPGFLRVRLGRLRKRFAAFRATFTNCAEPASHE